ncbi:MAG: transglutaminase-like domain-containing protein [Treponema sp.]|nr:transglutaminase-like domain-containing protein [Treponema sp.]
MKRQSVLLFTVRLVLYFSVMILIFIHPGISVSFDRIGIIVCFFLIPIGAFITFFHSKLYVWWLKIAPLEPFILTWVCLRLLSLSRSGEEIAGKSIALTQFILVWTAVVFIVYNLVIYLCIYTKSRAGVWKESLLLSLFALIAMILILAFLPPDFIRNSVIENLISERIPEKIKPSDSDKGIPKRSGGRRTLPRDGEGGRGELRGISEHNWPGGRGNSGEARQYMIKIVISQNEPVYMGNIFNGQLDPVKGFQVSREESLNDLANQRFFVTWFNNENENDIERERNEILSLSTLRQKYLPYRPVVIDPTILSEETGPLRYIHQVVSNTHSGDPLMLVRTPMRLLNDSEKKSLSHYLEINLEEDDKKIFETLLKNAIERWKNNRDEIIGEDSYLQEIFINGNDLPDVSSRVYMENILAILTNFSQYQYNLNKYDDHSIDALKDFLLEYKEGDCVEFSNSFALLGRLAGIPSRVVTGYLASEGLQTPAHLRGIAALRSKIPFLQQFPFDNLFMVTNLHSHSWTQFYLPDYGWLDFEATAFSIAPEGMGDFNNWDVVIPILDENRTFSQVRKFPWRAAGKALLTLLITAIIAAYALRYTRELILYLNVKHPSRAAARSLYLLLLAKLAADGNPIKPASKTAHEYSELFGINNTQNYFKDFAEIYSELRWREFPTQDEFNTSYAQLKQSYESILNTTRKQGMHHTIKRLFSLRGLAYL